MYTLVVEFLFTKQLISYYSLKSCSALEELRLSGNEGQSRLPDVFGAMSSLRILNVSHCSLTTLPERYVNSK